MISSEAFYLTPTQRETYRRFARLALPRHTSYPIAPAWQESYAPFGFRQDLALATREGRPFSLYVHLPFCQSLCYYCACTKEIIPPARRQRHDPAEDLLQGLAFEAQHFARVLGPVPFEQVHFGGGSPTFLTVSQLEKLWDILRASFAIAPDAEIAIEIDPRITTLEQLRLLKKLGFNRVSLGIQDFDPRVQLAVNRQQPLETVKQVVGWCRELGFPSLNFDLIYGLPFQTLESMADTLKKTLALQPDRVAFYRLAIIPEIFRWQNVFKPTDLPGGDLPVELNLLAIRTFLDAGYEFIGLDHFARPDEPLARARRAGGLHRNFQGMTTGKCCQLIGLGPSAISQLDHAFAQNRKSTAPWLAAVADDFAVERGLRLTEDDRLRGELLQQLYGHGFIDKSALAERFGIDFDQYFALELEHCAELAREGLVEMSPTEIRLTTPLGRLLVRVAAAVFDRYLPPRAFREGLREDQSSKVG